MLSASPSCITTYCVKATTKKEVLRRTRRRLIICGDDFNAIYHIVSHGGDYDNASRNCDDSDVYHIVSHGGDYDNASRDYDDFNRIDFIFIVSRNGDSNNNGCGNNICYPPAPRLSTTCHVKAATKRMRYSVTHGDDSSYCVA